MTLSGKPKSISTIQKDDSKQTATGALAERVIQTGAKKMKLSIVMSNYNGARFINEAIDSVMAQNFSSFEFLVIDDGSTDASRQIMDAAASRYGNRVRMHYVEKNQGQGECCNMFYLCMVF